MSDTIKCCMAVRTFPYGSGAEALALAKNLGWIELVHENAPSDETTPATLQDFQKGGRFSACEIKKSDYDVLRDWVKDITAPTERMREIYLTERIKNDLAERQRKEAEQSKMMALVKTIWPDTTNEPQPAPTPQPAQEQVPVQEKTETVHRTPDEYLEIIRKDNPGNNEDCAKKLARMLKKEYPSLSYSKLGGLLPPGGVPYPKDSKNYETRKSRGQRLLDKKK